MPHIAERRARYLEPDREFATSQTSDEEGRRMAALRRQTGTALSDNSTFLKGLAVAEDQSREM
jgi:hypothetical protein